MGGYDGTGFLFVLAYGLFPTDTAMAGTEPGHILDEQIHLRTEQGAAITGLDGLNLIL
jgi:hypothetical protein